jgi:hypothetical protein
LQQSHKSVAEKYTLEWQNKNGFCSKVEGMFGKIECTPGL